MRKMPVKIEYFKMQEGYCQLCCRYEVYCLRIWFVKSGGEIRNFIEKYGENKNSKLYQALADTIMRANWQELKEERKMCEALRELFADDLKESELKGRNAGRIEGKIEGRTEGAASKIIEQVIKKCKKGYSAEATAAILASV